MSLLKHLAKTVIFKDHLVKSENVMEGIRSKQFVGPHIL